jgi:hypothetical protein
MGNVIFGRFFRVAGVVGLAIAAVEGVGWFRRNPDADNGAAIGGPGFAVVGCIVGHGLVSGFSGGGTR